MWKPFLAIIAIFFIAAIGIYWSLTPTEFPFFTITTENIVGERHFTIHARDKTIAFDLIDPESSPPAIHDRVMHGYRMFLDTPKYLPDYVGNQLCCNNCHFCGGNNLGGKNAGISLVGVTAIYPKYSTRAKKVLSLKDRINGCFMRSMNGKPLPENGSEMNDLIAYLTWISQEVLHVGMYPWLGLPELHSHHQPDITQGALVYQENCSHCHGADGEGAPGIPPLCGDNSFNDGAGMNLLQMSASFIYRNMPYEQPILTKDQALDVAAYLISRPRPHFDSQ
jgi:thiosulfate dehydrogenase